MNTELLQRVRDHIANDAPFSMGCWYGWDAMSRVRQDEVLEDLAAGVPVNVTSCDTPACIAGWAVLLADPDAVGNAYERASEELAWHSPFITAAVAELLLGLDDNRLFFDDKWPQLWTDDDGYDTRSEDLRAEAIQLIDELLDGQNPWDTGRLTGATARILGRNHINPERAT